MKYQNEKNKAELVRAYEEYAEFCKEDDKDRWEDWEACSLDDIYSSE